MINFNRRNVNIISFFISSVIFIIIVFFINFPFDMKDSEKNFTDFFEVDNSNPKQLVNNEDKANDIGENSKEDVVQNEVVENNETTQNNDGNNEIQVEDIKNWTLEIKALNMIGPIKQMENDFPDENYINHYKETAIIGDNIALFAYNFGASKNYFANLKDLRPNDEIIYTVNDKTKKYKVISNKIIEKESLNINLYDNNQEVSCLKLFTNVIDLEDKLRYICAKEIIDI